MKLERYGERSVGMVSALAALVLASFALAPIAPAEAAFPGRNGKIAFVGSGGIETINPDGTGRTTVTTGGRPAWSADGSRLAFDRDLSNPPPGTDGSQILTINADGSGEHLFTSTCGASCRYFYGGPSWSPDDKRIAYTVISCGPSECNTFITSESVDGQGGPNTFNTYGYGAKWSPDGTRVAFTSSIPAYDCYPQTCYPDVYIMNVDGSGRTALTSDLSTDYMSSWSPDGSKIAFVSDRDGNDEIYTMNADGSGQTRITNDPAIDGGPVWSPDGSKIAFHRYTNNFEIYIMNPDGTGLVNLTNTPNASEGSPDWQPIPYGYARPVAASPAQLRLVPSYKPCTSANGTHQAPLTAPSCNPPQQTSDFLTVGTADANGAQARSVGSANLKTITGDEQLKVSITDVRQKGTLADYAGEIQAKLSLRITDRTNGACDGCPVPGTATDLPFNFTVPCTATSDTSIGSICAVSTTANAVLPGSIKVGRRSIWELGRFELYDGGPDGDADTADNTLFAVQGLFAP